MVTSSTAHTVLVLLAVLAVALLVDIALPFATSLFVASVLAGALYPWTERLGEALGGRRKLAAGLVTLAMVVSVVGPLSALGAETIVHFEVAAVPCTARLSPRTSVRTGRPVKLAVDVERLHLFDPVSGHSLR